MSINWVMLDGPTSFIRLPREKTLFTSPPRTSLSLQTPNPYPGKEPLSIKASDGKAIITNQRLIYLPSPSTPALQSFSSPLLSLHDTHVSAPFFGPNIWTATFSPTPGGGIPQHHALVSLKLTFKEGGAFDFSNTYERIKEVVAQSRENGGGEGVDLEELPRYEEVGGAVGGGAGNRGGERDGVQRPVPIAAPRAAAPAANNGVVGFGGEGAGTGSAPVPDEAPPGYDEVGGSSVVRNLETRAEKGGMKHMGM